MKKKPTSDDVARLANVSRTTISLGLNNVYKPISAPRCFSHAFTQILSMKTTRVEGKSCSCCK
jgi:hypothetical protein